MSIVSYERFDKDGIEMVINTQTGEGFATKRGYARMSGKDESTIRKRLKVSDLEVVKDAQILTAGGMQGADLITEDMIAEWLPKDNPAMATQLLKLGVRVFLHKMAGFEVKSEAVVSVPQPYVERVLPVRDTVDYIEAAAKLETLSNGILKHLLKDALVDQVSLDQNLKYLPVAEKPRQYTIAKVRAKSLGYSESQIGDGTQLGRFIKSQIEPAFQEHIGRFPVFHYEINAELDTAIHRYFNQ